MFTIEGVGLINHQHTTLCLFKHLAHRTLFVTPMCTDESSTVAYHNMPFRQCSSLSKQGTVNLANGGFACAWFTVKDTMQRYFMLLAIWKHLLHELVVLGQCYQLCHTFLYDSTSDQLVQFFLWITHRT